MWNQRFWVNFSFFSRVEAADCSQPWPRTPTLLDKQLAIFMGNSAVPVLSPDDQCVFCDVNYVYKFPIRNL